MEDMSDTQNTNPPSPLDDLDKLAQEVVDKAAAAIPSEKKAVEPDKKPEILTSTVEEHPISEADAQKFAGKGDYNLPLAPIDEAAVGKLGGEQPKPTEKLPNESTKEEKRPLEAVPELTIKEALSTLPKEKKNVSSVGTADLEQKAKNMLEDLDKGSAKSKPTKKKRSGAATKMALVAMLVMLMGAGGIVGVNLLKLQQSAENRSQAGGTGSGCTGNYECDDTCSGSVKYCYQCNEGGMSNGKCINGHISISCGTTVVGCGVRCHCCDGQWLTSTSSSCSGVCDNNGGEWGNCSESPDKCGCSSWSDGCGTGCRFPDGTQDELNRRMRDSGCTKTYVAMCAVNGEGNGVYYEEYTPSQACYGKLSQCNNPTSTCNASPSPGTPTPTPGTLQCTGISKSKTPVLNDTVTFTCAASGSDINHYEFRYKIDTGDYQTLAAGSGNTSAALTVSSTGTYTVQCRACSSTDSSTCTTWGQAE